MWCDPKTQWVGLGEMNSRCLAQVVEVVDAANVATKLLHAIREPLVLNGTGIVVSGSIGITLILKMASVQNAWSRTRTRRCIERKSSGAIPTSIQA